jgi:lipoprotein-releasing system permease protein
MNISFVLTMLAIDKRTDVALLLTMGIEKSQIKQIFLRVGALIALSGAILGLVLGGGICFAQEQFGMVSMGMVSSMIEAYPVKMEVLDFTFVSIAILVVTLGMAYFPARKASETELRCKV